MEYLLQDKINILGLNTNRISFLKSEMLEELEISYEVLLSDAYCNIINSDDIVGTTRHLYKPTSWLDYLDELHKNRNFNLYNKNKFDKILLDETLDGPPEVIKKDGKYYIDGNGKHRLTMAKCLGYKNVKVVVRDYNLKEY